MTFVKPYAPTTDLVALAALKAWIPNLAASFRTKLPDQPTASVPWPDDLSVTLRPLAPTTTDVDVPQRMLALVALDFWAAAPDDDSPLWARATQAAMVVREALTDQPWGRVVDLGDDDYRNARVQAFWAMTEPRRIENDPSAYARVTFDARLDWIALPAE